MLQFSIKSLIVITLLAAPLIIGWQQFQKQINTRPDVVFESGPFEWADPNPYLTQEDLDKLALPEWAERTVFGKPLESINHVQCVRIIEGDTIEVFDGETKYKVRFDSVDCPKKKQPFSDKAKQATGRLTHEKKVGILKTGVDRYGRTIAFVVADGVNMTEYLIKNGLGWHYKKYSDDPELAELERQAREKKLNIWSDPNPVAPWDWHAESR